MYANIKTQWTAALRSGKFQQGPGSLVSTDSETGEQKHCCLGVLCELAVEAGIVTRDITSGFGFFQSVEDKSDFNTALLPYAVVEWAGLTSASGKLENYKDDRDDPASLTQLNDSGRYDFDKIADVIDSNL